MDEEQKPAAAPPAKSGKGTLIIAIILSGSIAGGGAFAAPRYLGSHHKAEASAQEPVEPPANPTVAFQPIVIDVRAKDETMHHLKVTLTFELADGVHAEEFDKYVARGREAAILFMRGQTFETVTDPERFPHLGKELSDKVTEAVGKKRIRRVMITDFVTQ